MKKNAVLWVCIASLVVLGIAFIFSMYRYITLADSMQTTLTYYQSETDSLQENLSAIQSELDYATQTISELENEIEILKTPKVPDRHVIAVDNIQQNPELPNGCEGTSLTILLNYLGFDADKVDICTNYVPLGEFTASADPNEHYLGDPRGAGWYVYAEPIITAAENYLSASNSAQLYEVNNLTGATKDELITQLGHGNPVVVWTTLDLQSPGVRGGPETIDGPAYTNLHCVVLVGYTETQFLFTDPLKSTRYTEVSQDAFMTSFESIGSQAVTIEKIDTDENEETNED